MIPDAVKAAFARQSEACAGMGSPFMGQLMGLFSRRSFPPGAVLDRIRSWEGDPSASATSLPLRLAGGFHGLKLSGDPALAAVYPPNTPTDDALWAVIAEVLIREEDKVLAALNNAPQTNEVRRSAVLIPTLHLLAGRFGLPIRLLELGCSGGLNLAADQFHLVAGTTQYGATEAPVHLTPAWQGPAPEPAGVQVTGRHGVDLNPLDVVRDRTLLLSYLWPDQDDRIARTEAAIAVARSLSINLSRGDAGDWLNEALATRAERKTTLVYHTIAWQYFPAETQAKAMAALEAAGRQASEAAPLARFSMEADGNMAALTLTLWPDGTSYQLGRSGYHGERVNWSVASLGDR